MSARLRSLRVITALSAITLATAMGTSTACAAGTATAAGSSATYQVGPVTDVSTCGGQNAEAEQAVDATRGYVYEEWMGCKGIALARSTFIPHTGSVTPRRCVSQKNAPKTTSPSTLRNSL